MTSINNMHQKNVRFENEHINANECTTILKVYEQQGQAK